MNNILLGLLNTILKGLGKFLGLFFVWKSGKDSAEKKQVEQINKVKRLRDEIEEANARRSADALLERLRENRRNSGDRS